MAAAKKGKNVTTTTATTNRKRSRAGYVMVELEAADRKKLEVIRDRLEAQIGSRVGLAGAIRWLLRRAE